MRQRCDDPKRACPECNGYGRITKAFGTDMRSVKAMIDAGLGYREVDTAEIECKACIGTGKRFTRPEVK